MKVETETSPFVVQRGELLLDGEGCVDLLRATLAKQASLRLCVKGFSMIPFIRDGDVVTLAPLPPGGIAVGKVIACLRSCDRKMVVHRLVKVRQGPEVLYIPKGDNAGDSDGPVLRKNILAVVEKVERRGKPVSLGMGPEREWIALLSRMNLFCTLSFFWRWIPLSIRQRILGVR